MGARQYPYTQPEIDRIKRLTETHGPTAAAAIAGTCTETIANMRRRGWTVGRRGPGSRVIPSDFAIQAAHLTIHQLVAHYGACIATVRKWAAASERQNMVGHRRQAITIPADLALRLRTSGTTQTAREVGVHPDTVRKWRRQLGLDKAGRMIASKRGWVDRFADTGEPRRDRAAGAA